MALQVFFFLNKQFLFTCITALLWFVQTSFLSCFTLMLVLMKFTHSSHTFLCTELLSYLHVLFTYKPQNLIFSFLLGFLITELLFKSINEGFYHHLYFYYAYQVLMWILFIKVIKSNIVKVKEQMSVCISNTNIHFPRGLDSTGHIFPISTGVDISPVCQWLLIESLFKTTKQIK